MDTVNEIIFFELIIQQIVLCPLLFPKFWNKPISYLPSYYIKIFFSHNLERKGPQEPPCRVNPHVQQMADVCLIWTKSRHLFASCWCMSDKCRWWMRHPNQSVLTSLIRIVQVMIHQENERNRLPESYSIRNRKNHRKNRAMHKL